MARPRTQKVSSNFATKEQKKVESPISSGDTVALYFDVVMRNGHAGEGYHTNHESKKTGKLQSLDSVLCNLSSDAQAVSKLLRAEPEVMALGASLLLILREACMSSAEA